MTTLLARLQDTENKSLLDILEYVAQRRTVDKINPLVLDNLNELSDNIEMWMGDAIEKGAKTKLGVYYDFLSSYVAGFKGEEYLKRGEEKDKARFFTYGCSARSAISRAIQDADKGGFGVVRNTYEEHRNDFEQVLELMEKGLKDLIVAYKNPSEYVIKSLREANVAAVPLAGQLADILDNYSDEIAKIALENLEDGFEETITGKKEPTFDDHVQLGIFYLSEGRLPNAQYQFNQAQSKGKDNPLSEPLRHISSNIANAGSLLMQFYSVISFAYEFEHSEKSKQTS